MGVELKTLPHVDQNPYLRDQQKNAVEPASQRIDHTIKSQLGQDLFTLCVA